MIRRHARVAARHHEAEQQQEAERKRRHPEERGLRSADLDELRADEREHTAKEHGQTSAAVIAGMTGRRSHELEVDVFERRTLQPQVVEPRARGAKRIGEADDGGGGIGGAVSEQRAIAAFERGSRHEPRRIDRAGDGEPERRGAGAARRAARAACRRRRSRPADRITTRSASASISSR